MQHTGRCAQWRRRWAMRHRQFTASGRLSACNRTAAKRSSSRPTRCSSTRCATLSASTWPRLSAWWCCASMRNRRSRPWTAPSRCCRCARDRRNAHDYTRHATLSLFAALDAATGKVVGRCFARHRAREFRAFLNTVEASVPDDLDVHIIIDNVSSHKTQAIRNWFAKRPRWHVHYTPTSASWLNQVERFFANLTDKQIRRGVHRSTAELEAAIKAYIETVNANPRPFVWTKSAEDILATIKRFCLATLRAAQTQTLISKTSESRHSHVRLFQ